MPMLPWFAKTRPPSTRRPLPGLEQRFAQAEAGQRYLLYAGYVAHRAGPFCPGLMIAWRRLPMAGRCGAKFSKGYT